MKPATAGESSMNRNDDDTKYRGVRKRKWGKWVSEIRLPNSRERIWLGSYDSPEKAARAFDAALFCLRGNTANFNFPDHPPNIPGGTDLHPSQIQAVAADFANSSSWPSSSSSHRVQHLDVVSNNYDDHTSTSMDFHMSLHDESSAFVMDHDFHANHIPDYGIFPGFDDYFMQPPSMVDYGEEVNYDGVYSQDPSFLWNFS